MNKHLKKLLTLPLFALFAVACTDNNQQSTNNSQTSLSANPSPKTKEEPTVSLTNKKTVEPSKADTDGNLQTSSSMPSPSKNSSTPTTTTATATPTTTHSSPESKGNQQAPNSTKTLPASDPKTGKDAQQTSTKMTPAE